MAYLGIQGLLERAHVRILLWIDSVVWEINWKPVDFEPGQ